MQRDTEIVAIEKCMNILNSLESQEKRSRVVNYINQRTYEIERAQLERARLEKEQIIPVFPTSPFISPMQETLPVQDLQYNSKLDLSV